MPVLKALDEVYTAYGQPQRHRSDNGPPFNSHNFKQYSAAKGIEHVLTYPHHPQGNPCETFMKPLGKAQKAAFYNRDSAQGALDELLKAYRSTPHPATKVPPGDLLFRQGYHTDFPRREIVEENIKEAHNRDEEQKQQRRSKMNSSKKRVAMPINIGDKVLLKTYPKGRKFEPIYGSEVYEVIGLEDKGVRVSDASGEERRRHKDDIKLFHRASDAQSTTIGNSVDTEEEEGDVEGIHQEAEDYEEEPEEAEEIQEEQDDGVEEEQETDEGTRVQQRPQRAKKLPGKLQGFLLKRVRFGSDVVSDN